MIERKTKFGVADSISNLGFDSLTANSPLCRTLRTLTLKNAGTFTTEVGAAIARLQSLTNLAMHNEAKDYCISDQGFTHMARLPYLKSFSLLGYYFKENDRADCDPYADYQPSLRVLEALLDFPALTKFELFRSQGTTQKALRSIYDRMRTNITGQIVPSTYTNEIVEKTGRVETLESGAVITFTPAAPFRERLAPPAIGGLSPLSAAAFATGSASVSSSSSACASAVAPSLPSANKRKFKIQVSESITAFTQALQQSYEGLDITELFALEQRTSQLQQALANAIQGLTPHF